MKNKTGFAVEMERFEKAFGNLGNKRIALYGIGRRTAALIANNTQYKIVALMDRDERNEGKYYYGLPVVSLKTAERIADMIVISAPQTYWGIIYKRIENSPIPVFFPNGQRATIKTQTIENDNPYWHKDIEQLKAKALRYDIISFDLFDTLITRRILRPEDVFELTENKVSKKYPELNIKYRELRNEAVGKLKEGIYSFEDIIKSMAAISGLDENLIKEFANIELEIERKLIIPRGEIIDFLNFLQDKKKQIYIISDMYYSGEILRSFIFDLIKLPTDRWLISCELKKSKADGSIWEYYSNNIVKGRRAIHFGDDDQKDLNAPKKHLIDTEKIMSMSDMLRNSTIRDIEGLCTNAYHSVMAGTVISRLFADNPFVLNENKGNLKIDDLRKFGYCYFGCIIYTYLNWMISETVKENCTKILFLSRDSYLIEKDYQYMLEFNEYESVPNSQYMYASRRTAYIANIDEKKIFEEWIAFPYNGSFRNYLGMRFSSEYDDTYKKIGRDEIIQMPTDYYRVKQYINDHYDLIRERVKFEKENYIKYLKESIGNERAAIADIGYYGTIQKLFNKCLDLNEPIKGFYFYADLENHEKDTGIMKACFQKEDDPFADNVNLKRFPQLIESLFTAPYGMVLSVDKDMKPIFSSDGTNQSRFAERETINEGIKECISDLCTFFSIYVTDKECIIDSRFFADEIFGVLMDNFVLDSSIKDCFYWDDAIVQTRENRLFE